MFLNKIRKKLGLYDLRLEEIKWVKKNIGEKYVDEFIEKYDKVNQGIPIGGIEETVIFLHLIEKIKSEI